VKNKIRRLREEEKKIYIIIYIIYIHTDRQIDTCREGKRQRHREKDSETERNRESDRDRDRETESKKRYI